MDKKEPEKIRSVKTWMCKHGEEQRGIVNFCPACYAEIFILTSIRLEPEKKNVIDLSEM